MELDDMKSTWMENDAPILLNARAALSLTRTEGALQRHGRAVTLELLLNAVVLILIGTFIARYFDQPRFLLPALALHLAAIALTIACIRQLAQLRGVDYGEPIVAIQRRVESMRIEWIRTTQWTFLTAALLWTPLLIVAMKGLFGLDAWTIFDKGWLAVNFLFGAALIPAGLWVARRFGRRWQGSPWMQRLMDDLAGRSLTSAKRSLEQVTAFVEN